MPAQTVNESWIVKCGDQVIQKKAQNGPNSLTDWERLVYCLWVADYMMCNAGDFANAADLYHGFQTDAKQLAKRLSLPKTYDTFALSRKKLQAEYFKRFEAICDEIKQAGNR